jgi:hypothetical protein
MIYSADKRLVTLCLSFWPLKTIEAFSNLVNKVLIFPIHHPNFSLSYARNCFSQFMFVSPLEVNIQPTNIHHLNYSHQLLD